MVKQRSTLHVIKHSKLRNDIKRVKKQRYMNLKGVDPKFYVTNVLQKEITREDKRNLKRNKSKFLN